GMRKLLSNRSMLLGGEMLHDRRRARWLLAAFAVWCAWYLNAQVAPDRLLRGTITGKDNLTYKLVPFTVPAGVKRITVEFAHTGAEQKTVIDLGLIGPRGLRGWSGGRTGTVVIAETDATPSYPARCSSPSRRPRSEGSISLPSQITTPCRSTMQCGNCSPISMMSC